MQTTANEYYFFNRDILMPMKNNNRVEFAIIFILNEKMGYKKGSAPNRISISSHHHLQDVTPSILKMSHAVAQKFLEQLPKQHAA